MKKITIDSEPKFNETYPKGLVSQVKVTTVSGQLYEELIIYPKGHPERPVTDKDMMDKYEFLSTITWDKSKSEQIKAAMLALDELTDVSTFVKAVVS